MKQSRIFPTHLAYIVGILLAGLALRYVLFQGMVLCDDIMELHLTEHAYLHGLNIQDQLHVRFGTWIFNVLFYDLFDLSEFSFFFPTVFLSSLFGVFGYLIAVRKDYSGISAFLIGLFIVSAPFEVLIGTLRANDIFLAWFMAVALWVFLSYEDKPILKGMVVALMMWFGFYVKLWVVYFLPALFLYYLYVLIAERSVKEALAYGVTSISIHGATLLIWKQVTGVYLPFISNHAAAYPVPGDRLFDVLTTYVKYIFVGSDIESVLFGIIPYLLLVGLSVKLMATFHSKSNTALRFNRVDIILFGYYSSFLLLLTFFPNSFAFDQYYSVPRIFRYTAPLSFPMTLHAGLMAVDIIRGIALPKNKQLPVILGLSLLIVFNIHQSLQATGPGRVYRERVLDIASEIRSNQPPHVVAYPFICKSLRDIYLRDMRYITRFEYPEDTFAVRDVEKWLDANQTDFKNNTLLVTGINSCVHYSAIRDGFSLSHFQKQLHPSWHPLKVFSPLPDSPTKEDIIIWVWKGNGGDTVLEKEVGSTRSVEELNRDGVELFQAEKYAEARLCFAEMIDRFPQSHLADTGYCLKALTYYRQDNWNKTIDTFGQLIRTHPESRWIPAAHVSIGISLSNLGKRQLAMERLNYVVKTFRNSGDMVAIAEDHLKRVKKNKLFIKRLFDSFVSLLVYIPNAITE